MTAHQFTQFLTSEGLSPKVTRLDSIQVAPEKRGEAVDNIPAHSIQYTNTSGQETLVIAIGEDHRIVAQDGVFV